MATLTGLLFALLVRSTLAGLLTLLAGFLSRLRIALLLLTRFVLILLIIVHLLNSKGEIALQPLRGIIAPARIWGMQGRLRVYFFYFARTRYSCVEIIQLKTTALLLKGRNLSDD
ncbi:MAG TPA: hypothetical protein VMH84_00410 [Xanthobacteraceae bacterium]|nr:hypothetical protein [Xanthobacteraceae bacterium]